MFGIDYKTAKLEVLSYYKENQRVFISDVAWELELDLELVANITDDLVKEGRLRDTED